MMTNRACRGLKQQLVIIHFKQVRLQNGASNGANGALTHDLNNG